MRRFGKFVIAACIGCLAVSTVSAATIEEMEKTIGDKLAKIKSMSADMKMTMQSETPMKMSMVMTGNTKGMQHDGKYYSRSEMQQDITMMMGETEQKMTGNMTQVVDGEHSWIVSEQMGQKQCMKNKIDDVPPVGDRYFESMKESYDLAAGEDKDFGGEKCWTIIARPKDASKMGPMGPEKMHFYFRQSDGVLMGMEGYATDATAPMMTMTYSNVKVNETMDPASFKFTPPEGVPVMDMTESGDEG